jgi:hypothetical protein
MSPLRQEFFRRQAAFAQSRDPFAAGRARPLCSGIPQQCGTPPCLKNCATPLENQNGFHQPLRGDARKSTKPTVRLTQNLPAVTQWHPAAK